MDESMVAVAAAAPLRHLAAFRRPCYPRMIPLPRAVRDMAATAKPEQLTFET